MADPQRNEELEITVRSALEGPDKDLGRLCKSLGEAFCLQPARNAGGDGADGGDASLKEKEHHEAVLHAVAAAARVRQIKDCRRLCSFVPGLAACCA